MVRVIDSACSHDIAPRSVANRIFPFLCEESGCSANSKEEARREDGDGTVLSRYPHYNNANAWNYVLGADITVHIIHV